MEKKTEFLSLKCVLTERELKEVAQKLAQRTAEKQAVEDDKKSAAAQFKAEIEAHQAEINRCAGLYRNGYEMRQVECEVVFYWDEGRVRYFRIDTGEIAHERDITTGERQMKLADAEREAKEAEAAEADAEEDPDDTDPEDAAAEAEADRHQGEVQRFMTQERSAL